MLLAGRHDQMAAHKASDSRPGSRPFNSEALPSEALPSEALPSEALQAIISKLLSLVCLKVKVTASRCAGVVIDKGLTRVVKSAKPCGPTKEGEGYCAFKWER